MTTAKGHLCQEQKNLQYTKQPPTSIIPETTATTTPDTPVEEPGLRANIIFIKTIEISGKIPTDQIGAFPVTSSRDSKYLLVLADHDSNTILVAPIKSQAERELLRATKELYKHLTDRGLNPQILMLDNKCSQAIKNFIH